MVIEPVDTHDLINGLGLLPTDPNLITGDNIPVLDTVLRFRRLDNGVPESHPPFPITVVREEMAEGFCVRAGRPGLKDLIPPEHFRDRH